MPPCLLTIPVVSEHPEALQNLSSQPPCGAGKQLLGSINYPHFVDGDTKAQSSEAICFGHIRSLLQSQGVSPVQICMSQLCPASLRSPNKGPRELNPHHELITGVSPRVVLSPAQCMTVVWLQWDGTGSSGFIIKPACYCPCKWCTCTVVWLG